MRASEEIEKNIDQSESYSPEYKLKKANNYDNTVANAPRMVLEEAKLQKLYSRKPAFSTTRVTKFVNSPYINLGHSQGPGGRAFIYGTVKKDNIEKKQSSQNTNRLSKSSHVYKRTQLADSINSWNHYDTNLKNQIGIQKKIIDSKNNELDHRAISIN